MFKILKISALQRKWNDGWFLSLYRRNHVKRNKIKVPQKLLLYDFVELLWEMPAKKKTEKG